MAPYLDNIDAFLNAFFNFAIEPWSPEIAVLRQQYLAEEEELKKQGRGCCGAKADLIRKYARLVRPHFV